MTTAVQITDDRLSVHFADFGPASYELFLKVKRLPEYSLEFHEEDDTYTVSAPARFAPMLGVELPAGRRAGLEISKFLFDDQAAITEMALEAKRFACWAACGLGKGLLPECPVLTPNGFVPLSRIKVGDNVIGANGIATTVLGYFPRGVQPLFRVTFSDGAAIVCDGDHLWNVKNSNDLRRGHSWRTMSTRQLADSKLKYGIHGQSRTWSIPLVEPVQHPSKNLPVNPYILGVLLGDGSINGSVTWCKPDEEIAERVKSILPNGTYLERGESTARATVWRITGTGRNNPVLDAMREIGLDKKRSWEKFVPPDYLIAAVDDRMALLQGLMDTDGYAGETPEFCSTSLMLASAVVRIVESLGGTARMAKKESPQYSYAGEQRTGRTAYRVTMTLPPQIVPFALTRKATEYKPASRGLGRWIDSIEPVGHGETICIKVESPDGLFVIDKHIVTHNTPIQLEWARHVAHRTGGPVLLMTLNEIVPQTMDEVKKFYGDSLPITRLTSRQHLRDWCGAGKQGIAITNYEKMNPEDLQRQVVSEMKNLAGIGLDENRLKTGGGKQKWALIKSCKGIEYKLSCTATPAPNDLMEFASQASFLEKMRSEGEIIWTYFTRDQKTHRWTVKPHARAAFFEFLASWSIYVQNPNRYGWRQGFPDVPKPVMFIHELESTPEQRTILQRFSTDPNGQLNLYQDRDTNAIQRNKISQLAKGFYYRKTASGRTVERVPSLKPKFVADLVRSEAGDGLQVLVWTVFDAESDILAEQLGKTAAFDLLTGRTKPDERLAILERFRTGETRVLISRANMLGWGMNFQHCGSMIFSGWGDSFESWYQALRRAYRYGQLLRLRVHVPMIRALEGDQFDNIQRKEIAHERSIAQMEDNYIRYRSAVCA